MKTKPWRYVQYSDQLLVAQALLTAAVQSFGLAAAVHEALGGVVEGASLGHLHPCVKDSAIDCHVAKLGLSAGHLRVAADALLGSVEDIGKWIELPESDAGRVINHMNDFLHENYPGRPPVEATRSAIMELRALRMNNQPTAGNTEAKS